MMWPRHCVRQTEPLANHTSFRIGGPAEYFAQPDTVQELADLLREAARVGMPVWILGGGTNLLVADEGLGGLTIQLGRGFRTLTVLSEVGAPEAVVRCGAAVMTQRLIGMAGQLGWRDLERLAGLPGQVGGAVVMNAQSIGRFVERMTVVTLEGTVREFVRQQLHFAYRYTALEPGIIVEVVFRFPTGAPELCADRIRLALTRRNATQELQLPSAGCAFKNPEGACAGALIDRAGLKGARVGDARVSFRHANFIVNLGHATCDDVLGLMDYIQRRIAKDFRTWLDPEVRILGARLHPSTRSGSRATSRDQRSV